MFVTALERLVTEKPAFLGVSSQVPGVSAPSSRDANYGLDAGGVVGVVATAASAIGVGLSVQGDHR